MQRHWAGWFPSNSMLLAGPQVFEAGQFDAECRPGGLPGWQVKDDHAGGGIAPARGSERSSVIRAFGGCLGTERR